MTGTKRAAMLAGLAMLTACGETPQRGNTATTALETPAAAALPAPMSTPSTLPAATAAATPMSPPGRLSCAAEIGALAANRRAAVCRDVSPATRPPCNAANSCAMIEDEIARSCALFDGDGPPMKGCGPAPTSKEAAAAVVQRYYSAINARDYGTAWSQWGDDGRPGQTYAAFEAGFAHTRGVRVTIGRLQPGDAGAGSVYQPVPVTVDATLDDGRHQRFRGTYVVRRVNGVDGASPAQLRWHLDSAQLRPVSAG